MFHVKHLVGLLYYCFTRNIRSVCRIIVSRETFWHSPQIVFARNTLVLIINLFHVKHFQNNVFAAFMQKPSHLPPSMWQRGCGCGCGRGCGCAASIVVQTAIKVNVQLAIHLGCEAAKIATARSSQRRASAKSQESPTIHSFVAHRKQKASKKSSQARLFISL